MTDAPPKRVLIVDDESDLCEMLAIAFDIEGMDTVTAKNGREAFAAIQKEDFDIVISDVRMPGGDGIELLANIRDQHPRLPLVILTTGFADLRLEDAYDRGAEALFVKPFALRELIACVRNLLNASGGSNSNRRDIRVSWRIPLTVTWDSGTQQVEGVTENLSKGGLFFSAATQTYPPTGAAITISFVDQQLPPAKVQLAGVVAWQKQGPNEQGGGCGVVFDELRGPTKSQYLEMLNGIKTTQVKPPTA